MMIKAILLLCLTATALAEKAGRHVVGGSNTDIANHNHQLSLRYYGGHFCGASLISTTRGVTAAHCGGGALSAYSIIAGCTTHDCFTPNLRYLTDFVKHENYTDTHASYPNDIAIIKWNTPFTLGSTIGTISVASCSDNFIGQTCTITGWGKTCANCGLPIILQEGQMTVITKAACESVWTSELINDGHICSTSSSVSVCMGDSGGPLVCGNSLVGVTSWGHSGCDPIYPSIFTRITYFNSWIVSNLN